MQSLRYAVSLVIYRNEKEFLVVKRPEEDKEIGGLWGLPASRFDPKTETPDQAVLRASREKLNCGVEVAERLPLVIIQKRRGYDLMLIDYICRLLKGEPDVSKARTQGTVYVDQKWVSDPKVLLKIAEKGSICAQIFLNHLGVLPAERLRTSL